MKVLYDVEVSGHMYVMAETYGEAESIARMHLTDEPSISFDANDVIEDDGIWSGWENALPYGSDDNRTVRQLMEDAIKEAKRRRFEANHPTLPFGEKAS